MEHGGRTVESAFVKALVRGAAVRLTGDGLVGDEQADRKNHGGPDKAVCVYSLDHYPYWVEKLGRPLPPAAFGENFGVEGMTEEQVCIGDVYAVGEGGCRVEVSQPRIPCFKMGMRNAEPELPNWAMQAGRTGFYFRCVAGGEVQEGDALRLRERPHPELTIAEANRLLYGDRGDAATVRRFLASPALADSWRSIFERWLSNDL
jgi:MOSC domain-containing protein YiiM